MLVLEWLDGGSAHAHWGEGGARRTYDPDFHPIPSFLCCSLRLQHCLQHCHWQCSFQSAADAAGCGVVDGRSRPSLRRPGQRDGDVQLFWIPRFIRRLDADCGVEPLPL